MSFVHSFAGRFLVLTFLLTSACVRAQVVTIPDPNFVTFLQTNYPSCISGDQLDTQCPDILSATYIDVQGLNIADLTGIQYFTGVTEINAQNNQLTYIPEFPAGGSLFGIYVDYNQLTSLPPIPAGVIYLNCGNNFLTSLPPLPDGLAVLGCQQNDLSTLPTLPASMANLICGYNPLVTLPALPYGIYSVLCESCQLTSIPDLPQTITAFDCSYNPGLYCLPILPEGLAECGGSYGVLTFPGTGITCFPNIPAAILTTPSLPICVDGDLVNNPNACPTVTGIYGSCYRDVVQDCNFSSEPELSAIKLLLIDNLGDTVYTAYTMTSGPYHFSGMPDGDYSVVVDTTGVPYTAACANPGNDSTVTVVTGGAAFDVNFALDCKPGFDIGVQSVVPVGWVFPGQAHVLKLYLGDIAGTYGLPCSVGVGGQVQVIVTGPVEYQGPAVGALTPSSVSGDTLLYTIPDFSSFGLFDQFAVLLATDTTAQSGDDVCVEIHVTPLNGDSSPANNDLVFCYEVQNSYDPNIKEVFPYLVTPGYENWLTYTIHFQNTGSAPAFNIKLIDTLDVLLRENTFELLGYSHPIAVDINGKVVTFKFNNIMLPDSASDPTGSIGTVQFRIKPVGGIQDGTVLSNKTAIYFDFNPPIITNEATTLFTTSIVSANETQILVPVVYPNPSSGQFFIQLPVLGEDEEIALHIVDISGQEIKADFTVSNSMILADLKECPPGLYFLQVKVNETTTNVRLLKN